jgi:molybdopterin-guanine dinucleotide biosynthesis protein B
MRVFGFTGRSGAGKTTLIERLLPVLIDRGLTVSTMKHAHHGFDMDRPGKDTWRHREAGAQEVMVVSGERWALLAEHREPGEPDVDRLIERMTPVDLLLIEGFRAHSHPKIEVFRPTLGHDLLWRPNSDIVAVASDEPIAGLGVPVLNLDDVAAVADFVAAHRLPLKTGARVAVA